MSHPMERIAPRLHASISEFSEFVFAIHGKLIEERNMLLKGIISI